MKENKTFPIKLIISLETLVSSTASSILACLRALLVPAAARHIMSKEMSARRTCVFVVNNQSFMYNIGAKAV